MTIHTVTLDDATQQLAHLIAAALRGERIVITLDEQHAVRLVPFSSDTPPRRAGSAKGLIHIAPDFDAPLVDFQEYME